MSPIVISNLQFEFEQFPLLIKNYRQINNLHPTLTKKTQEKNRWIRIWTDASMHIPRKKTYKMQSTEEVTETCNDQNSSTHLTIQSTLAAICR